jgi:hypothetical protein
MTGMDVFTDRARCQADAILVDLDLFWHTDAHMILPPVVATIIRSGAVEFRAIFVSESHLAQEIQGNRGNGAGFQTGES